VTGMLPLVSTAEAGRQPGLNPRVLDYWVRTGTITPRQPPSGRGSRMGWSPAEVATLAAIGRVRADLLGLGLSAPRAVIGELWDQLATVGAATISAATVTISVRIGDRDG
jgi:DNA-binding transcriptional MerR regulator